MPIREELYLPPVLPDYNAKNGRFKRGSRAIQQGQEMERIYDKAGTEKMC